MRILAEENMPQRVVGLLRAGGHDVEWARESHRGTPDPGLLELSTREGRTLITYDADFGVLVNRDNMPAPYGVVFFRIHSDVPEGFKRISSSVPPQSGKAGRRASGRCRYATSRTMPITD